MFLASSWLEIYIDFQIRHFADFEQFKFDIPFANFGQVKTDPIRSHLLTLDRSHNLMKIIFNDSVRGNQELVSAVNK